MIDPVLSRPARHVLTALRVLLALAFILAGWPKLTGDPMMVNVFERVGLGQWFRYATGLIEVVGGLLLLIPRFVGFAALLLFATATGAIIAHLTVIPGSAVPAVGLALLTGIITWFYRGRIHVGIP